MLGMISIALVRKEKERTIMAIVTRQNDWSSQSSAEVIEDTPRCLGSEKIARIQTSGVILLKTAAM